MSRLKVLNAKRAVAVFMVVLMTILSLSYTSNNQTDAANTTRRYYVYNAKTGDYKRWYDLSPVDSSNNTRSVIGNEERIIDWTKSGVVKLISYGEGYYSIGSGFVVGDHVIATAAHCAYNKENKKGTAISKILLFDTNGSVTLEATPIESNIPYDYKRYADKNDNNNATLYDYALITVKEDLSSYACFDLGAPLDSFNNSNSVVTVTGFPGKWGKPGEEVTVNTDTKHMMYSGNGKVSGGKEEIIYYQTDTSGGNSGGPVYITESIPGYDPYYTVVAIHTFGNNGNGNHGTRITTDLIHFYSANNKNLKW